MASAVRIVLVDDHPLMLEATKLAIEVAWPGADVRCAASLEEAYRNMAAGWLPQLALIDLGMPGHTGLGALHAFRQSMPEVPVVVFSGLESREHTLMAIDCGAMGFIPKKLDRREVLAAIHTVMRGEIFVPRILFRTEAPSAPLQDAMVPVSNQAAPAADALRTRIAGLTERQREVMELMLQGLANKVIARRLGIVEGTVKTHIGNVLEAMGASNRLQAVLAASAAGIRVALHG